MGILNAIQQVVDTQEALEASRLTAPISGMIIEVDAQAKDRVTADPILTIAQVEPPTVEVSFDESDWQYIEVGNLVKVTFDALPEKVFTGQIVFVNPSLQSSSETNIGPASQPDDEETENGPALPNFGNTAVSGLVELDADQAGWVDLPLLSEGSVEVIAGEALNALLLPVEALQEDEGERGKVLVLRNDEYIVQEVKLGLRGVLYVEITDGISEGEIVYIGNYK